MIQGGDTIKIEKRGTLQTHTVAYITETKAHYSGGSIAKVNLCWCGDFWLEMAAPRTKTKPLTAAARRVRVPSTKIKLFGGAEYAPGKFDWAFIPNVNADKLHVWRRNKWIRAEHQGCWHFHIEDVKRIASWRDPVGRMVGGKQFYTPKEIARRTGQDVECVTQWGYSKHVEKHRPDGAVVALSWSDVKQHMRYLRIEWVEVKK